MSRYPLHLFLMINYAGILSHYFELCASVNPLKLILILSVFRDRGEQIVLTVLRYRVGMLQDAVPILLLCLIHNGSLTCKTQASESISQRCCVIAGFILYSHIQYFSDVIFLLAFFCPSMLPFNLEPKSKTGNWEGGLYACVYLRGKSFSTTNSLKNSLILNWKDPLFWLTGDVMSG